MSVIRNAFNTHIRITNHVVYYANKFPSLWKPYLSTVVSYMYNKHVPIYLGYWIVLRKGPIKMDLQKRQKYCKLIRLRQTGHYFSTCIFSDRKDRIQQNVSVPDLYVFKKKCLSILDLRQYSERHKVLLSVIFFFMNKISN